VPSSFNVALILTYIYVKISYIFYTHKHLTLVWMRVIQLFNVTYILTLVLKLLIHGYIQIILQQVTH
jgi:hypothetical protein